MQIEIWDPHFHLWDVSEDTISGHDSNQLFAPNENPVKTESVKFNGAPPSNALNSWPK